MKLLSNMRTNAKTRKLLDDRKIEGRILYLEPSATICPAATAGCMAACLKSAGRMAMTNCLTARQRRTELWEKHKQAFLVQLHKELSSLQKSAEKKGYVPVCRLNGTSDVDWMSEGIMNSFPGIVFYDYTKRPDLAVKSIKYDNYHITFSRSGRVNESMALKLLKEYNINIAVVFSSEALPDSYLGYPVADGDTSDFRFLDNKGHVIGLKAKGKARQDTSGFVVQI